MTSGSTRATASRAGEALSRLLAAAGGRLVALGGWLASLREPLWHLIVGTVGGCLRYRVTGLAAEAAFFGILSLPPLIFGLAGTVGYVAGLLGEQTVAEIRDQVLALSERVLTPDSVANIIEPTVDDVLAGGRAEVISVGFVLALWSGSRALNVFVDTITIMYGLGGKRGIVRTRALSFTLYIAALIVGVILLPLLLAGPGLVSRALPEQLDPLVSLYWPVVAGSSVIFLTWLYHLSVPVRTQWRANLPGAVLSFVLWVLGSLALRWVLTQATGSTSIYGPLAAPIAVLVWLYLVAIAVLIGAALNATWDQVWPSVDTAAERSKQEKHTTRPLPRLRRGVASRGDEPPES